MAKAKPKRRENLQWFLFWCQSDGMCIKAEPFDEGEAFWISQEDNDLTWECGYGDIELGLFDSLAYAIGACERYAGKRWKEWEAVDAKG